MIVILGTAHLGTTPGKRSPDGKFRECEYSREIVKMIKEDLEKKGVTVVIDYEPLEPNAKVRFLDCSLVGPAFQIVEFGNSLEETISIILATTLVFPAPPIPFIIIRFFKRISSSPALPFSA